MADAKAGSDYLTPSVNGIYPNYLFADSFTEFTWKDLPDFYSCENGHGVDMLMTNGVDDIVVMRNGTLTNMPWGW